MRTRTAPVLQRNYEPRLRRIDKVLKSVYGDRESGLSNKQNPLDEAIYIILSFQTNLKRFKATWANLRREFPNWEVVRRAPMSRIARVLKEGGLQHQKARTIKQLLNCVNRRAGKLTLGFLRTMSDTDAERFLLSLPGISYKAARCVLVYSLGRQAFPVDTNVYRVLRRASVLTEGSSYRARAVHDTLQAAVPARRRRALHVNLVIHGQRVCTPKSPKCFECRLRPLCPRVGLPDHSAPGRKIDRAVRQVHPATTSANM